MQLIKAFKTETVIEGMAKAVLISVEIDHDSFDGSGMESDEIAKIEAKIERGGLDCVWVKVTARFSGLENYEGWDSMGQVFASVPGEVGQIVSEYDMVENAIDDLKTNVLNGQNDLSAFLGKVG